VGASPGAWRGEHRRRPQLRITANT
jgi:hypothetical protein